MKRRPTAYTVSVDLSHFEARVLRQLSKQWIPRGEIKARAAHELRYALRAVLGEDDSVTGVNLSRRARRFEKEE